MAENNENNSNEEVIDEELDREKDLEDKSEEEKGGEEEPKQEKDGEESTELVKSESTELTKTGETALAEAGENGELTAIPDEKPEEESTKKKKIPKWLKITGGIVAGLAVLIIILLVTGLGKKLGVKFLSGCIYDKMEKGESMPTITPTATPEPTVTQVVEAVTGTPTPTQEITEAPTPTEVPKEDKIINFLLLGEENIGGGKNSKGRTDSIVLASLDTKNKTLKLISIMRDCYLQIPGYLDNRINAAYSYGGIPLLFEVLWVNFGIVPDQYALVRFDDFEKIIDCIGGIDIELSSKEASYLNRTNYISNPKYRNVVAGMNHLNGNQVVGYCRVRKVSTKENENSDFGRTTRHREVLEAIATQLKTLSVVELWNLADECLPLVTVSQDMTAADIEEYMNLILDIGISNIKIEGYRIPMDGTYWYATERGMSVVGLNIQKNRDELHRIIYGFTESEAEEAAKGEVAENTVE